ncbi:MAG TPA: energy transducer TonB [Allosphingosinicella sp.]|jgi:protein TonB
MTKTLGKLLPRIFLAAAPLLLAASPAGAQQPPWTLPAPDYGGAKPLNREAWYTFDDYPMAAIRAGAQGYVTVSFEILPNGRVGKCKVTRSSRHRSLDTVLCPLLKRRARFEPARGADGSPVQTTGTTSMSFWMPKS